MALTDLLEDLKEPGRSVTESRLTQLSNLEGEALNRLAESWAEIPVDRRLKLLQRLFELTEDNVQFDFDAVFQQALQDAEPAIRVEGIAGLWESDDPRLADRFAEILVNDDAAQVRASAASALGKFILMGELGELAEQVSEQYRTLLIRNFEDPAQPLEVRGAALESLGSSTAPEIADLIAGAHASREPRLRRSALYAMGRHLDPRWIPILLNELENEDPQIRQEAVLAIGEMEDRRTVPEVVRLTRDEDSMVRLAAIDALAQIGGAQARRALQALSTSEDEAIRDGAEEALEALDVEDAPTGFQF